MKHYSTRSFYLLLIILFLCISLFVDQTLSRRVANLFDGLIVDTSQEALRISLGNYFYPTQNNFAFSEVEFMVPEGTHVFRLASHFCSFGDKLQLGSVYDLNNGLAWQRTSTNVWGVYDYEADGSYEWKGQQKEIVKNRDVYMSETVEGVRVWLSLSIRTRTYTLNPFNGSIQ